MVREKPKVPTSPDQLLAPYGVCSEWCVLLHLGTETGGNTPPSTHPGRTAGSLDFYDISRCLLKPPRDPRRLLVALPSSAGGREAGRKETNDQHTE